MKKTLFLLLLNALACGSVRAQANDDYKEASKESEAYHEYRMVLTEPPFGLQKINGLCAKIKAVDTDGDEGTAILDPKKYSALSFREKFTYHMIHPESFSQNCDAMPTIQDEQKKIFGQLPDAFGDENWSDRQHKFFIAHKDSVIALMQYCITKDKRVGLNFKHAIVDINAKEMIPFLISIYNEQKKDHDILTVLMLLMKNNAYQPFMVSASNKKLYADPDDSYKSYLNFNVENEELIIKRALDFYSGGK